MVAGVSANLPPIQPSILAGGGTPLPTQTTTTQTLISPVPAQLTVTRLVGGETLISAQKIGGGSCLCADDVQPVPGDPQATVKKLQKVLSEASAPGSTSSDNEKLLAQARAALSEAQAQLAQKDQGGSSLGNGPSANPGTSAYNATATANAGVHAPQGVNASSVSVFA